MKKKMTAVLSVITICLLFVIPVFAAHPDRLVDNAGLLSQDEAEEVVKKLDEVSEKYDFDLVVLTTNSIGDKTITAYADDYYDENGYGMASDRSGAMLVVDMGSRSWYITTAGEGKKAFTDYGIQQAGEEIASYLKDEDYQGGFLEFVDIAVEYIDSERNEEPVDVNSSDSFSEVNNSFLIVEIVISIVIGFLISLIITAAMKSKMKTVKIKNEANDYLSGNSVNLTVQDDRFLYHNVVSIPIPRNNGGGHGGGGGSSTHMSSGGVSHGGGGGHF